MSGVVPAPIHLVAYNLLITNHWSLTCNIPTSKFFQVTAKAMHMAVAFIATPASSKAKWAALPAQAATAPSQLVSWTITLDGRWKRQEVLLTHRIHVWYIYCTYVWVDFNGDWKWHFTTLPPSSSSSHGSGKWSYCRRTKSWGTDFQLPWLWEEVNKNVDILR